MFLTTADDSIDSSGRWKPLWTKLHPIRDLGKLTAETDAIEGRFLG